MELFPWICHSNKSSISFQTCKGRPISLLLLIVPSFLRDKVWENLKNETSQEIIWGCDGIHRAAVCTVCTYSNAWVSIFSFLFLFLCYFNISVKLIVFTLTNRKFELQQQQQLTTMATATATATTATTPLKPQRRINKH